MRVVLASGVWLLAAACGRTKLEPGWLAESGQAGASASGAAPVGFAGSSGVATFGGTFSSGGMSLPGMAGRATTGGVAGMAPAGDAGSPETNDGGASGEGAGGEGAVVNVEQVSVGPNHSCAVDDQGQLSCWGLGAYGALGYGSFVSIGDDELPASAGHVALSNVHRVAVGERHTCVTMAGGVKCWGANAHGELGYGHTRGDIGGIEQPANQPFVAFDEQGGLGANQLVAGARHTCAVVTDGVVTCWGDNQYGQLGYGHTDDIGDDEAPASAGEVQLTLASEPDMYVVELAAGANHTCALLSNGSVRCWGDNQYGQLGLGHTDTIGDDELPWQVEPVSVIPANQDLIASDIAAGERHSCAMLSDQSVRCWGTGLALGLGNDAKVGDDELPSEVAPLDLALSGRHVHLLTAGARHSCAWLNDGNIKCWGENSLRQLGYAHASPVPLPVDTGTVLFALDGVYARAFAAGGANTCALLSDDSVKCWGQNDNGQLGQGTTEPLQDGQSPSRLPSISLAP